MVETGGVMTLTLTLLAFAFGLLIGRVQTKKPGQQADSFNVNMLPPADDEHWELVADKYKCVTHGTEHPAYRIGHVTALKGCGFYVANDFRWQPAYANEVFARQSERKALASWGES